jgi:menaquinone-dependent protoporphyrinogen oxidase
MDAPADLSQHPKVVVAFASRDGHAAAIAGRVGEQLRESGVDARVVDLTGVDHASDVTDGAALVAVVAAVRYGKHLPAAERFLEGYAKLTSPPPLALASVNLTARKPNKRTLATNPYLSKAIARHRLTPRAAAVFAGRLDYPRYRWFDRQMIRFIMLVTGGPTDPRTTIDYTDWASVDAFADAVAGALVDG